MKTLEELVGDNPLGALAMLATAQGAYEAGRAFTLACGSAKAKCGKFGPLEFEGLEWKNADDQTIRVALTRVHAAMDDADPKEVYDAWPMDNVSWEDLDEETSRYIEVFTATAQALLKAFEIENYVSPAVQNG